MNKSERQTRDSIAHFKEAESGAATHARERDRLQEQMRSANFLHRLILKHQASTAEKKRVSSESYVKFLVQRADIQGLIAERTAQASVPEQEINPMALSASEQSEQAVPANEPETIIASQTPDILRPEAV